MKMDRSAISTPLPTSPARGEVPGGGTGTIQPQAPGHTLPLAGRVEEGMPNAHCLIYRRDTNGH